VLSVYLEGDRGDLIGLGVCRNSEEFRRGDIINLGVCSSLQVVVR